MVLVLHIYEKSEIYSKNKSTADISRGMLLEIFKGLRNLTTCIHQVRIQLILLLLGNQGRAGLAKFTKKWLPYGQVTLEF